MTTSGWFGEVPEGWQAAPLFGIATERKIPNKGLRETNLLSLSYGRIVRKDIETNEGLLPASFETYQIVKPDDIVLRMTDLQNDQRSLRSALVGETGIITSAYLALALRNVDSRFMAYQFRAIDLMKVFYSMGGGLRQSIGFGDLKRLPVLTPPLEEQRAIADYLDRETAQIDAFIAKNEELITLLTERRRATIGSAVTRGIRRDAPTRPSGIAWLGDVPSHWSVTGLARYAGTVSGVGFPESEQGIEDAEIAFYKVNSLGQADVDGVIRKSWDTISRDTARYLRAKILPPGTILLAKIGAALLLGRIRRTDRPACIDNNMMAIVPNEHLNARFASYALQTFDFETLANPGTVPSMDMYALMHRETAVPPLVEQEEIADYLDRRLAGIDAALATCRRAIDLARERRAALISAAVTGKIDVGVAV